MPLIGQIPESDIARPHPHSLPGETLQVPSTSSSLRPMIHEHLPNSTKTIRMECPHLASLGPNHHAPGPAQSVYREDCTQCFDSIDDPAGLDVCLTCFNGGCAGDLQHAKLHNALQNHPLSLHIRRTRKAVVRDEPPAKISKLAIAAETESDRYDTTITARCLECCVDLDKENSVLAPVIQGIMTANTFSRKEEVKAWEQELTSCEHILTLQQGEPRKIESQSLGHCSQCDLKENLWVCLECGNLGCGRAQFGGVGGNSHALAHAKEYNHGVAVKLGSITPQGTADVYCYTCDEERIDDNLATHLANWGIILAERQKTEKSLTEMQIEQNLRWEFSMTTEDGKELVPLFGPGLTGLKNLGNSCYLASILQCLYDIPAFRERYFKIDEDLPIVPQPAEDLETQLRKIGHDSIFIDVPLDKLPVEDGQEAKYRPVTLRECLDDFTAEEMVELTCRACGSKDGFSKRQLFKTLPDTLAVNARKMTVVNWVPVKVDVPVIIGDEVFELDRYLSKGMQPGEETLPEDVAESSVSSFVPNAEAVAQLEAMGFPRVRCEKALHATGNDDANVAMEWLFAHMEDPDIDTPLDLGGSASGGAAGAADPEQIEMLGAMGFSAPQARKALKETGGNVERAVEWLFSHPDDQGDFEEETPACEAGPAKEVEQVGSSETPANYQLQSIVCHKGTSIHAGHYVAFIRKEKEPQPWVLFNDEKVVKAVDVEEMKKFAYVYFFRRV
ncbi:hypothetical protein P8C59_004581 [Phyllachora maydis]|uniref:Ubiquitin carboxyl-terminal hydrolase n=1 Tax=Phyllachora maydis TaxID=1825666 RepID=A0AAD9I3X0_9PEZI|nr:hypothetical protein P8C59_004581 [Phyllachora maydis]